MTDPCRELYVGGGLPHPGRFLGWEAPSTPAWEQGSKGAASLGLWGGILGRRASGTLVIGQKTYISPWEYTLTLGGPSSPRLPGHPGLVEGCPPPPTSPCKGTEQLHGTSSVPDSRELPVSARCRSASSQDVLVGRRKADHKSPHP